MMYVKIHKSYRDVVAICDADLIGKKFEEGKKQLNLKESFYKDKKISFEEAIRLIQFQKCEDATFNLVGPESVKAGKESGIINEEGVKTVQGVPFALILL